MKKLLIIMALAIAALNGFAQDTIVPLPVPEPPAEPAKKDTTYWTKGGVYGLTFTQVALQNWAAGGQNSLALNTLLSLHANYKRGNITWDNSLDMGYGLINQAKLPWWEKSDDKIDLNSKFGRLAFDSVWYYSALLNFKTQFSPGFDQVGIPLANRTLISDFMAPAYIVLALGLDYKPDPRFSMFLAPVTGKITIVNNQTLADKGAFGVPFGKDPTGAPIPGAGSKARYEFGAYIKTVLNLKLMENINLTSKLDLFTNYLENPGNIDVNWDVLITMKINKSISATLNTTLIYDDDINIARDPDDMGVPQKNGPVTQFKEVFALGINYKFKNR